MDKDGHQRGERRILLTPSLLVSVHGNDLFFTADRRFLTQLHPEYFECATGFQDCLWQTQDLFCKQVVQFFPNRILSRSLTGKRTATDERINLPVAAPVHQGGTLRLIRQ